MALVSPTSPALAARRRHGWRGPSGPRWKRCHDGTASGFDHARMNGRAISHAAVDGDRFVPLVGRRRGIGLEEDSSVVDEARHPARRCRSFGQSLGHSRVGDVADEGDRSGLSNLDRPCRSVETGTIDVNEGHCGSLRRTRLRDRGADAVCPAGDDDYLVRQPEDGYDAAESCSSAAEMNGTAARMRGTPTSVATAATDPQISSTVAPATRARAT